MSVVLVKSTVNRFLYVFFVNVQVEKMALERDTAFKVVSFSVQ